MVIYCRGCVLGKGGIFRYFRLLDIGFELFQVFSIIIGFLLEWSLIYSVFIGFIVLVAVIFLFFKCVIEIDIFGDWIIGFLVYGVKCIMVWKIKWKFF